MINNDPLFDLLNKEQQRQQHSLELIASENFASPAVLAAQGSVLTNKYAEGYYQHRYYGGCKFIDEVEMLAITRAQQLFGARYVNVQPHSGSQANQAVYLALLKPGDKILGMSLQCGGHLTHGSPVNQSGKWFNAFHYGVDAHSGLIDMDEVETIAKRERPRLIIAGGSAYPRHYDFARFRRIADAVGAMLLVDMAHFAGLVAGGCFPSPLAYADVITATTHKTLRGPRGGMILTNDARLAKKIDSAIFPGLQGGPLMHVIAAKAVALGEALQPEFKRYAGQVIENAQAMCQQLAQRGLTLLTGGTDCHLGIIDLRPQGLTGVQVEYFLELAGITVNKNTLLGDPQPPSITSGIRIGSAACATRGMKADDFTLIADWISEIIFAIKTPNIADICADIRQKVTKLTTNYPLPYQ
ncbi:TPA: serine hydroxymethyltransferase [Salmonella enterica subsp. enterica serovar Typhi str. CT18]|uniref:serine hydroxymethyltransferase n=1 Tax=Salmonella enterica TaxID=28901 RepID=UPI0005DDC002|nr:serine hydroxymethyltransferase [Salmonella enterica]HCB6011849.1 serine hydroxymethyltransferase [Salmonella enterica subsp. enterica serovar Typhi str. CT18]ELB7501397.1 serine hydroxymethyltransferase [Salmonella enterica]CGA26533.1 serine hydroxymethyltransferase [Salmonella enterica subsp. enterica serovar Typhi]CGY57000.1 serine hydroxymethyltransferase [Salmonella enterica subsp. enterica serovar Typhi]CHI27551.1 serine hydroxymethyltransferase [Salmonella enterica subsp. enterica se